MRDSTHRNKFVQSAAYIYALAEIYLKHMKNKKTVVVITLLIIAVLFVVGAGWTNETIYRFFQCYFADIAIPFGYYLLLVLLEDKYKPIQKWYIKAAAIFILCSLSETLQYFGIYTLARVFDPLDYLMYALGVVLAIFADRFVFRRWFSFWR